MTKLRQLTAPEKLLIWRGRLRLGQEDAGKRFDCSAWTYGEMERGRVEIPSYVWRGEFAVRPNEYCLLSRRRSGLLQREVARLMGCSKIWVSRMEKGLENCDRLVMFWGDRGVW